MDVTGCAVLLHVAAVFVAAGVQAVAAVVFLEYFAAEHARAAAVCDEPQLVSCLCAAGLACLLLAVAVLATAETSRKLRNRVLAVCAVVVVAVWCYETAVLVSLHKAKANGEPKECDEYALSLAWSFFAVPCVVPLMRLLVLACHHFFPACEAGSLYNEMDED